jgi:hypothetical protein
LLLAVIALAGCDKLLSLNDVKAPPDAPPGCAGRTNPVPFFCADFDEMMAVSYGDGVQSMVPPGTMGVMASTMPPAVSPPYALWVDASKGTGGHYDVMYSNSSTVTKLHAELDLRIDGATPNTSELVDIGVDGPAGSLCHFQLQVHNDQTMRVRWYHCPGLSNQPQETTFFGSIPVDFKHYALDFDIANMTASVTFNGVTTTDQLPPMLPGTSGTPFADIGVFAIGGTGGPKVGFDNVLVTLP